MFAYSSELTSLDLKNFDTSQVTSMAYMFCGCTGLTSLDLKNFDTSQVTGMSYMFYNCNKLTSLDVTSFDTSQVTDMTGAFGLCHSLPTLKLDSFNTSKVASMKNMFMQCYKLEEVTLGKDFAFVGTDGYLPAPDSAQIAGADGKWYDKTGDMTAYTPADLATVARTEAHTYVAVGDSYSLDKAKMQTELKTLSDNNPTTLKFVKGDDADLTGLTSLTTEGIQTDASTGKIGVFTSADNLTIWIAPMKDDGTPSGTTHVVYAPEDSSYLLCVVNGSTSVTDLAKLTSIDCGNLDTSKATNMSYMFYNCSSLSSPNVTSFNTANVTNMGSMFSNCGSLSSLDLSSFNTENVTSMSYMFNNCSASLTSLDLSNFDTSNVSNMYSMFSGCAKITSLNVSSFNTGKVTNMSAMFNYCSALTSINLSNFNTENVTEMDFMFQNCPALTSLDLSSFSTSKVTSMRKMFNQCFGLEEVTLGKDFVFVGTESYLPAPDGEKIAGADGKWYDKTAGDKTSYTPAELADVTRTEAHTYVAFLPYTIDKSKMTTAIKTLQADNPTTLKFVKGSSEEIADLTCISAASEGIQADDSEKIGVFQSEDKLTIYVAPMGDDGNPSGTEHVMFAPQDSSSFLNGAARTGALGGLIQTIVCTNLDTSKVTNMSGMFSQRSALTSLDVSSFDTSKVTNMSEMFNQSTHIISLDLSNFDTSNVTNMNSMFQQCNALTSVNMTSFKTSNVTNMAEMFYDCQALTSLDVSKFDTSRVTDFKCMFYNCLSLPSINVSGFDTSQATDLSNMFSQCKALTSIDVKNFNTSSVTAMFSMFAYCESLTSLDISNFDTSNVGNMMYLFAGCNGLSTIDLSNMSTKSATSMYRMFYEWKNLTSLNLSNFDTSKVTSFQEMFSGCTNLASLDLSSFSTSSVTNMQEMFNSCNKLAEIKLGADFKWVGTDGYLPAPDSAQIDGADGKWYDNGDGTAYTPAELADVTRTETRTYVAVGSTYGFDKDKMKTALSSLSESNPTTLKFVKGNDEELSGLTLVTTDGIQTDASSGKLGVFTTASNSNSDTTVYVAPMNDDGTPAENGFPIKAPADSSSLFRGDAEGIGLTTLTSIDCSNLDTSQVTDANNMFLNCSNLTSLDLSNFDTTNITNMSNMFGGCTSLATLDLSSFTTTLSTSMVDMFSSLTRLESITLGKNFRFSNGSYLLPTPDPDIIEGADGKWYDSVTGSGYTSNEMMSYHENLGATRTYTVVCQITYTIDSNKMKQVMEEGPVDSATTLKFVKGNLSVLSGVSTWDDYGIQAEGSGKIGMFWSYSDKTVYVAPITPDLHPANNSNVMYAPEDCTNFFRGDSSGLNLTKLTTIDCSNLDTSNVTNASGMFSANANLTSLDLSNFDTSKVTNMSEMFNGCTALSTVDLASFKTLSVTNMAKMFYNCSELVTIYATDNFVTSAVTEGSDMFTSCSKLKGGNNTAYDISCVDVTYARIDTAETPGYFTKATA